MNHKKIAELAHVSTSTVSKALSGNSEISKEVAEKIRQIAIENGYFKEKNKRKREYRNNTSILIAVLIPELLGVHYSEIVTHIKNEIESRGGHVAIYVYDFDKSKMNNILKTIILNGATDGVITFSEPDYATATNIPIVCFTDYPSHNYDSIGNNISNIISDCISYFVSMGHTDIGFAGELYTIISRDAFISEMKNQGLNPQNEFIYIADKRLEAIGIEVANKIIHSQERPTAIIAAYDVIALSLIHELEKNNISVPDDISIIGINNISSAAYANVPLTSVDTYSAEQYQMAVELLFNKIINEEKFVKHITIEHKIIERASVKNLNKKDDAK